jgi:hypothetical protein
MVSLSRLPWPCREYDLSNSGSIPDVAAAELAGNKVGLRSGPTSMFISQQSKGVIYNVSRCPCLVKRLAGGHERIVVECK